MFEPLNQCYQIDSTDSQSQFISDCANGKRTMSKYSDKYCKDMISTYSYPLSTCYYSGGAEVYETDICV